MLTMAIFRVYAGDDGQSHFEDVQPRFERLDESSELAELIPGSGILIRRFAPRRSDPWHHAPAAAVRRAPHATGARCPASVLSRYLSTDFGLERRRKAERTACTARWARNDRCRSASSFRDAASGSRTAALLVQ